jgi:hypothetical protein
MLPVTEKIGSNKGKITSNIYYRSYLLKLINKIIINFARPLMQAPVPRIDIRALLLAHSDIYNIFEPLDDNFVTCKACEGSKIRCIKKYSLDSHLKGKIHIQKVKDMAFF